MISNPDWLKPKIKPYMQQISFDCVEMLVKCQRMFNKNKIDYTKWLKTIVDILKGEIEDPEFLEFATRNFRELMDYVASGIVNIRIHRDVEGMIWFGAG